MASGDEYRARARAILERAKEEKDPNVKAHLESVAEAFLRFAEVADDPGLTIEFEMPVSEKDR